METKRILTESFLNSFDEEAEDVIIPEAERVEDATDLEDTEEAGYDGDRWEDPEEEKPSWLEDLEGEEGGDMGMEEMESLANIPVDLAHLGKNILDEYWSDAFQKVLEKRFKGDAKKLLFIVQNADYDGKLSLDGIAEVLKKVQSHDDADFSHIRYADLLEAMNTYKRLKKRYRTKSLAPYQEDGIRRYSRLSIQKYFQTMRPDPILMLGIYLIISFGGDALNLFLNFKDNRQKA
ncbi:MAG: hypothetical protein AAFR61_15160 [Bacteroidota bacterium]